MKLKWARETGKTRRFTCLGDYRKTEVLQQRKPEYFFVSDVYYSGQVPLGIVDIEGREKARQSLLH